MNVLILGGTRFVGRHIVDALLARSHRVTLFNRGTSNPDAFANVEQIHGDRATDLQRLGDRTWDAAIDTSGYLPREVESSARYLGERTAHYLFVSSISAYAHPESMHEDAALAQLPPGADTSKVAPETYGALKALCEAAVRSAFGERAAIVRPGVVAGPYDPTDRFTYWPVRIAAGGTALAPDAPEHPIQYIDARDLAQFVTLLAENRDGGTYNAVTRPGAHTFGALIDACRRACASPAAVRWIDEATLLHEHVEPWSELPLWIPRSSENFGCLNVSAERAAARGLEMRPLAETVRDTLAWARAADKRIGGLAAGLAFERERRICDFFDSQAAEAAPPGGL